MRSIIITVFALMASGCSDSHPATGPSSNAASLRGQVMDFTTQAGIPSALVQFQGQAQGGEMHATTDASGAYTIASPILGSYTVTVDGVYAGLVHVTGPRFRGDLFVDRGHCISRYGMLTDSKTRQPVAAATIKALDITTVSRADGWYRLDIGCPEPGTIGFNTLFMYFTRPSYADRQVVLGRGVSGVQRVDVELEPR